VSAASLCTNKKKKALKDFLKPLIPLRMTMKYFSTYQLDASVRIDPWDRQGLERLIRYCARPPFASENLRWNGKWLIYRLSKPNYKGQVSVQLDPLEFLGKIAAFIPLPHRNKTQKSIEIPIL
jgi:hypothetical protein